MPGAIPHSGIHVPPTQPHSAKKEQIPPRLSSPMVCSSPVAPVPSTSTRVPLTRRAGSAALPSLSLPPVWKLFLDGPWAFLAAHSWQPESPGGKSLLLKISGPRGEEEGAGAGSARRDPGTPHPGHASHGSTGKPPPQSPGSHCPPQAPQGSWEGQVLKVGRGRGERDHGSSVPPCMEHGRAGGDRAGNSRLLPRRRLR